MRGDMRAEGSGDTSHLKLLSRLRALWTPLVVALCFAIATYFALTSEQAGQLASGTGWVKRYVDTWIIRLQAAIFVFAIIYAVWQLFFWVRRERISDSVPDPKASVAHAGSVSNAGISILFASRVRARLAPVTFAAWSLPVWGFIGTVSGVTDAIQALRDMADRGSGLASDALPAVLRGLYEAFDTTMVGLVLVIPVTILIHVLNAGFDDTLAKLDLPRS